MKLLLEILKFGNLLNETCNNFDVNSLNLTSNIAGLQNKYIFLKSISFNKNESNLSYNLKANHLLVFMDSKRK
jgi:hypothetical protein